ncbi:MAG: hypothetical protein JWP91_2960 [Fibrobacteres bacterium]|nr:hypothetical protein [Fibrobacterota bacterium]
MGLCFFWKFLIFRPTILEPFLPGLLKHDSAIFLCILTAYVLAGLASIDVSTRPSLFLPKRMLVFLFRTAAVILMLIYVLDVLMFYFFGTRLYFTDVMLFKGEANGGASLFASLWEVLLAKKPIKVAAFLLFLGAFAVAIGRFVTGERYIARRERRWQFAALGALAIAFLIPLPMQTSSFIYKPLVENVFERNRELLFPIRYSKSFREKLIAGFKDEPVCGPGRNRKMDIIVVIVESLSSYQSFNSAGILDYTPKMDSLASEYSTIPDFYANGWTTQGGLISLMTSAFPIVPERAEFNEFGSPRLKDYASPLKSLPRSFRDAGYKTAFYGAGDLTFMDQYEWLRRIGFEEISGDDAPEYSGQPRGIFKSVPDGALYSKALAYNREWGNGDRHLLVLETFWSHRPYTSPEGDGPATEESVFRYVDGRFMGFYHGLKDQGFFRNGILIVTGDHRAMLPYRKEEVARYGLSATTRVPLIIIEDSLGLPHRIPGAFSQKDLLPSLIGLISDSSCRSEFEGDFLAARPKEAPCIYHARGDDRDRLYVKCRQEEGIVELKGDLAHVVSGNLRHSGRIIDKMHYERIRN